MDEYLDVAIRLGINLIAVSVLAYAIYLRAHCRGDVAASLIALNVGLFAVLTALMAMPDAGAGGLAVGFGLFAVLSIIRLRSEASSFTDVAYFFTALAIGVVNGVALNDIALVATLNVALVVGMAVNERLRRRNDAEPQIVIADEVFATRQELTEHLARRLGARILEMRILEVDLVRETTRVEALVAADDAIAVQRDDDARRDDAVRSFATTAGANPVTLTSKQSAAARPSPNGKGPE
jgi:hypothetical protein